MLTQNEDVFPTRLINYWGSQLITLTSVLKSSTQCRKWLLGRIKLKHHIPNEKHKSKGSRRLDISKAEVDVTAFWRCTRANSLRQIILEKRKNLECFCVAFTYASAFSFSHNFFQKSTNPVKCYCGCLIDAGLAEDFPAHGRVLGPDDLQGPFPLKPFHDSMKWYFSCREAVPTLFFWRQQPPPPVPWMSNPDCLVKPDFQVSISSLSFGSTEVAQLAVGALGSHASQTLAAVQFSAWCNLGLHFSAATSREGLDSPSVCLRHANCSVHLVMSE